MGRSPAENPSFSPGFHAPHPDTARVFDMDAYPPFGQVDFSKRFSGYLPAECGCSFSKSSGVYKSVWPFNLARIFFTWFG